jgi:hypothetical protein
MTAPNCRADDCTAPQALRLDGVGLGYCPEHRAARLRTVPVGTVRPGPRGRGWRVKTTSGWETSTENGTPLRALPTAGRRVADPAALTDAQTAVLIGLFRLVMASDGLLARTTGLDKGTVSKRRLELADAGLVEQALPRSGRESALWRLTSAGIEHAAPLAPSWGTTPTGVTDPIGTLETFS